MAVAVEAAASTVAVAVVAASTVVEAAVAASMVVEAAATAVVDTGNRHQ
jgi:hypothetical protein